MVTVHIIPQSIYSHSFHRHFIGNFASSSMKDCMWMCQNNDYCRTATYRPSEQQCYLYEEYSYVGTISSVTDGSTVLVFDLCSAGITNQEPAFVCFGSERQSVPMQTVMNNLQLVKTYSGISTIGFVLAPGQIWVAILGTNTVQIYSLDDYSLLNSINTNWAFGIFDFDSQMQYVISYGSNGLYFSWLNQSYSAGSYFYTPCFSVTGDVVAPKLYPDSLSVYNRTDGTVSYQFNGSYDYASSYFKLACVVYNQTAFLSSQKAVQQVSIGPPSGVRNPISIFNFTEANPTFITTDASKRLYTSCVDCSLTNETYIITTQGNMLAQLPQKTWFAQGKASKYKYYFVTWTVNNVLSFYEY